MEFPIISSAHLRAWLHALETQVSCIAIQYSALAITASEHNQQKNHREDEQQEEDGGESEEKRGRAHETTSARAMV